MAKGVGPGAEIGIGGKSTSVLLMLDLVWPILQVNSNAHTRYNAGRVI